MYSFRRVLLGLLLCSACGSVEKNGHLPDAGDPADASIDAVSRGTVHVIVLDPSGSGAPAVGASVVFIDPDGTLVKKAATDSAGKADADVLPGANVTSVVLNGSVYQLQTVLAIKPGDDLILGSKLADTSIAGTYTVAFPAYTLATPAHYQIAYSCGVVTNSTLPTGAPPATTATFTITNNCKQDPMQIVVTATDANSQPLGSISKAGIQFVNGGNATLTGAYLPIRTITTSYTNINPIITGIALEREVPDTYGIFTDASVVTPGATAALTMVSTQADNAQFLTSVTTATPARQSIRQSVAGTAATYGLDLGAKLLPWVGLPTYDATATKITVPVDTTGTSSDKPDMFLLSAAYSRTNADKTTTNFGWIFFAPDAADITIPALPAELAMLVPTATDTVRINLVTSFEADTLAGYDAVRSNPIAAYTAYTSSRPNAATVRISRYQAR